MKGYIHSFESLGTVDGPGIRFVVFMQGCPMRCRYCHNPDTWEYGKGSVYTAEDTAARALRYKSYIKNGGVTVSGGEPLMQIDFVTEFFSVIKSHGLHTALDTSGITFDKSATLKFVKLLEFTDLVMLDVKHIDDGKHRELTGHSNKNVLDFAKFVSESKTELWIRHVLVSGITDKDEYLFKLKDFINGLSVKKIEILPYHSMGEIKYEKLGIPYTLKGMSPPDEERVLNAKRILGV